MADAADSKSVVPCGLEGSSPSSGTKERAGKNRPFLSAFRRIYLATTRFVVPVQSAVTILTWYTPEGIAAPLLSSRFQTRLC